MKRGIRPPRDIDDYLGTLEEGPRRTLERLRKIVRSAAPEATEKIGYRMPMFYYRGPLVAFAAFKDHCSFFPMSLKVIDANSGLLKPYDRSKGTIRFPADKPLPASVVKRLVKARVKENEEKAEARARRKMRKQ